MSMIIQMHAEADLLRVVSTGEFVLQEAQENFVQISEAIARYKSKKVLFDGRPVTGNPELMERFYYGEFAAGRVMDSISKGESHGAQFAYVLNEPLLDPKRFGETVLVNRGVNLKAFDNLEDALLWLGVDQPTAPTKETVKPRA